MKNINFIFILIFLISTKIFSQTSPSIQWQKSLGGSSNEVASTIQQTSDSGYIVVGRSSSSDSNVIGNHGSLNVNDIWVVKLNFLGNIQWQKCLGGTGSDEASSVKQTLDGGYILTGNTVSNDGDVSGNHGNTDCWIVKLNSLGNIQWQKCYGGSGHDEGSAILQTIDGGYIVSGSTNSNDSDVIGNHGGMDYWIVKINSSGNIQWQKCLGGSGSDVAGSIQQTTDSGYIVAGYTYSNDSNVSGNHGNTDYWIVKLNFTGNIQWQKCLGGLASDVASSIQQTTDGGFIVAGWTNSYYINVTGHHGGNDYWIVKLNSTGTIQWQKCFGGFYDDEAFSIQQTTDEGFIVAGYSVSNDGDVSGHHGSRFYSDYWIVKLSAGTNGISEPQSNISSTIYPNPNNGNFEIENTLQQNSNITFSIINLLGENLWINSYSLQSGKNTTIINANFLSPGIYFLRMEDDVKELMEVRKVLVR